MIVQMAEAKMLVQEKTNLDKARTRADRPIAKSDTPAAMFEKVLRAFGIGDLSFADLQSSLTRLLKDDAPADELLRVLQRRELIEPLPEDARANIIAVLQAAMPAGMAALNTEIQDQLPSVQAASADAVPHPSAADEEPDTSAMSRLVQEFAAAWDNEPKARPTPQPAAVETGSNVDYKAMRLALGQREDDLAALQAEHSRVLGLLEARARSAAQLQEELREVSGHLDASRSALESQQGRTREIQEVLAERIAAEDTARGRIEQSRHEEAARLAEVHQAELSTMRESLAAHGANIAQMQQTLAERDATIEHGSRSVAARDSVIEQARALLAERDTLLAKLQGEHALMAPTLESGAQAAAKLQTDLTAAQDRIAVLGAALASNHEAQSAAAQLQTDLSAAQARIDVLEGDLGSSRAAQMPAAHLQADLSAAQARIAVLEADLASSKAAQTAAGNATKDASAEQAAAAARNDWADKVVALQQSLDESHAAIEAHKQHHSKIVSAFMARAKNTENDLRVARARADALTSELQARGGIAAPLIVQGPPTLEPDLEMTMPLHAAGVPTLTETQELVPDFEATLPVTEARRGVEVEEFLAQPSARAWSSKPSPPAPGARTPGALGPNLFTRSPFARTVGIAALVLLVVGVWAAIHRAPEPVKVPEAAAVPAPASGTVIRDCPTCPSFTVVPAGRFKQGSGDVNASSTVRPLHWVAINYPLAISTNAVTVDEFGAFVAATGRDMQGCDTYDGHWKHQAKNNWQSPGFEQSGSHPVTCASWSDAKAYAQWLSEQTGHHYRLPSASEWEYAARAGSEAAQPWSANGSDACANANVADMSAARRYPGWVAFACNDGYVFTAPVGSFKANGFALNDMLGNVFQWTEDCWNANYKGAPIDGSARSDGNCGEHELRGGSWFSSPGYVRTDYRNHFASDYRTSSAGIRLVRDIAP